MVTSAALSDAQIANVVRSAGWTGQDVTIAIAVALAESGGNPSAINRNTNGSTDKGLFQVNSIHSALIAGRDLNNASVNAQIAFQIFKNAGNKWTPWSAYNNRSYARFLPRAQAVAGGSSAEVDNVANTDTATDTSTNIVTDGNTWKRLGLTIAGVILLTMVLMTVIKIPPTPIGLAARTVTKTVRGAGNVPVKVVSKGIK